LSLQGREYNLNFSKHNALSNFLVMLEFFG